MTVPDWSNATLATFNQTLLNDSSLCTIQTCPLQLDGKVFANTTYFPSIAGNALYTAIFALMLLVQIFLGFRHRTWGFLYGMFGGLSLEVLGYGARIGMHAQMFSQNFFIMYLVCLTIGPAFLSAAIYLNLSRIITIYSVEIARFRPSYYTYIFIASDFFALLLQSAGGAIASISDAGSSGQETGIHLMVAGVAFQVASLGIFAVLCLDFVIAVRKARRRSSTSDPFNPVFSNLRANSNFQRYLYALALATLFIFVRSVYRTAELQQGFNGKLANQQITFMVLEGVMIILAVSLLTAWHPGTVIGREAWDGANWSFEKKEAKRLAKMNGGSGGNGGVQTKRPGWMFGKKKGGEEPKIEASSV